DPEDPKIKEKLASYSQSLIEQIDTMSAIASAFSDFAKMPKAKKELLNVPEIVKIGLDIFNEDYIEFSTVKDELIASFDRTQLIRVVTNLIKNAIQATKDRENPKIRVAIDEVG